MTHHHFDYTSGLVTSSFEARVDVTGAANGLGQIRVGRSNQRGISHHIPGTGVSARNANGKLSFTGIPPSAVGRIH